MADNLIRWRRSDYAKLGKAVANFNRQVIKAENKNVTEIDYLPELKKYKNVKDAITTRREFNRVINALSRINKTDALDLVFMKSGQATTNWEFHEMKRQARLMTRNLEKEMLEYSSQKGVMGNARFVELKMQLLDISNFELFKGDKYKKIRKEVQKKGTSDWETKMQIVFKENFLKALEDYSNEPYYKELVKKLRKMDSKTFYEFVKDNNMIDFLSADWYKLDRNKYSVLLYNADVADIPDYNYGQYIE